MARRLGAVQVLGIGWSFVHATWVGAYLLSVSIGTEDRFCSAGRPEYLAGPFGSRSKDYPFLLSWKQSWFDALLLVGFAGAITLIAVTLIAERSAVAATMTNALMSLVGFVAAFSLAASQFDDGLFCDGRRTVPALVVLVVLVVLACVAVRFLYKAARGAHVVAANCRVET